MILEGLVLAGEELEPTQGYVVAEEGLISEVAETTSGPLDQIIMPGLMNCHTHIGDYIFREAGVGLPLRELVGTPDGLKHQLLRESGPEELVHGMELAEDEMIQRGTTFFLDFREQGATGVSLFRRSITRIGGLAFGRPIGEKRLAAEIRELAGVADGIGLDRVGLYTDEELETIRQNAAGKPISVHVSEGNREDDEMLRALDTLSAGNVVHLTGSNGQDLRLLASRGGSAAICPRSNILLGAGMPPVDDLLELGIPCGLGTDNCMMNSPDLFREMDVTLSIMKIKKPREVLKMATSTAARALGVAEKTGAIEVGKAGDILVLDHDPVLRYSRDVHASIVKRAGPINVTLVAKDGVPVLDRRTARCSGHT